MTSLICMCTRSQVTLCIVSTAACQWLGYCVHPVHCSVFVCYRVCWILWYACMYIRTYIYCIICMSCVCLCILRTYVHSTCIVCVCVCLCMYSMYCMCVCVVCTYLCLCVSAYMHTQFLHNCIFDSPLPSTPASLYAFAPCARHHVSSICFFPMTHILSVLPFSVSIMQCLASLSLDMEAAISYWAWYESVYGFRLFYSVWIMSLYHHFAQLGYLRGWSLTCRFCFLW